MPFPRIPRRPSWRAARRLVIAGGKALTLVAVAWVVVPLIASGMARSILEQAFARQFKGSIEIGRVSLGWAPPMRIEAIALLDDRGRRIGVLHARIPTDLWGLMGRRRDLRTIAVHAELAVVDMVDAYGGHTSNLARALTTRSAGEPWTIPNGHKVAVELERSSITYTEIGPDGRTLSAGAMRGLNGACQLDTRRTSGVFEGSLRGAASAGAVARPGTIELTFRIVDFRDPKGVVHPDKARADIRLNTARSPARMLGAMLGLRGVALDVLGVDADVKLAAFGTLDQGTFALKIASSNTRADLAFDIRHGRLMIVKPSSILLVSTAFLVSRSPFRERAARAGIVIEQAPSLDLKIHSLELPLGSAADLNGSSMDIAIETGPARFSATGRAEGAKRRDITIAAGSVRITSAELSSGLSLNGGLRATIGGESTGTIRADLVFRHLLDGAGHWRRGLPGSVDGSVRVHDLPAELLAPIVTSIPLPIDVKVDIGDRLDASLTARQATSGGTNGSAIATDIDVTVRSTHVLVTSAWSLTPGRVETRAGGFDARFAHTVPLIRRIVSQARDASVVIAGPGELQITSRRLSIPLSH